MSDTMRCPRRDDLGGWGDHVPGPDTWQTRGDVEHYRACSYCGSLHPDDFMEYARNGKAEMGPTDKNYKVYVEDPEITYQPRMGKTVDGEMVWEDLGGRATDHLKFYFQHLSEEQRREFVDLYNARPRRIYNDQPSTEPGDWEKYTIAPEPKTQEGMQVGYPGHFYRMPFFMTRGGEGDHA